MDQHRPVGELVPQQHRQDGDEGEAGEDREVLQKRLGADATVPEVEQHHGREHDGDVPHAAREPEHEADEPPVGLSLRGEEEQEDEKRQAEQVAVQSVEVERKGVQHQQERAEQGRHEGPQRPFFGRGRVVFFVVPRR